MKTKETKLICKYCDHDLSDRDKKEREAGYHINLYACILKHKGQEIPKFEAWSMKRTKRTPEERNQIRKNNMLILNK